MYHQEVTKLDLPYYQEVILFYKVNPCNLACQKAFGDAAFSNQSCQQFFCFGYHNLSERRRRVIEEETSNVLYQPVKCPSISENSTCAKGDLCRFSHTQNEILYHPLCYKNESCTGCAFQSNPKLCPYYHPGELSKKITPEKTRGKISPEITRNQQGTPEMEQGIFNLDSFKANPCPYRANHNPKVCVYYHHEKDRKRPVSVYNYAADLCSYTDKGKPCPRGDNCLYCHNKVEQLYHVERYKRKFCLSHPQNIQKCEYGDYCSFAHSESEIQIELLHNMKKDETFYLYKYKTVFCPYIYEHDRNQCVYAHNPQDFRRDPSSYKYDPVQCSSWAQGPIFSYEEGACSKQMECNCCHGWKELEFHPQYYKTKPCNNGKKCNKKDCPFYHLNSEKRDPQALSQSNQNFPSLQNSTNFNSTQKKNCEPNENDQKLVPDSLKPKFHKREESRYSRPIMPVHAPAYKDAPSEGNSDLKARRMADSSTRPNSNISSIYFSGEDVVRVVPNKKKKGKRMSLQNKKEKLSSPLSAKSDKPKGQEVKDILTPQVNIWKHSDQQDQDGFDIYFNTFESNKLLNKSRGNDSFDSWQSYTVEKNVGFSEKPIEVANEQFLQSLFSNLERKGLEHTIQHLKGSNPDVELLKSLSPKSFHIFPQITLQDKEKIVKIIQDVLEEEEILSEINTINEGGLASFTQSNFEEGSLFGNFGSYNNSHDFNIASLLQK